MNNLATSVHGTEERKDRLEKARQKWDELQKEIAPFLKRRIIKRATGAGKWIPTSKLNKDNSSHSSES